MTRIRLYVEQSLRTLPAKGVDATGASLTIPFLRAFVYLRIGAAELRVRDAILDTGAPLTVIPWMSWQHLTAEVEWITPVADAEATDWLTSISGKTGGRVRCRPGRIAMSLVDLGPPPVILSPVPVLALFEEEPNGDDRILVGLHASVLQGRQLHLDVEKREAWLEQP